MESAGEDLDNIFDEHVSRENNEDGHAPENNGESNSENPGVGRIQPPKRVVKNPRLKFNAERLCGERGIPVLVDHFKDVKFKGVGHEREDLDKLMSKLEHWTHRLFPSMKFEDCLHQIEKLGAKRQVQTCVRKIRLDMPILASDFVKDDEEDNVLRNENAEPVEADAFDQLLGENFSSNQSNSNNDLMGFDPLPSYIPPQSKPPESRGQVLGNSTTSLTEEQKEKLERNRLLAVERRKARLAALEQQKSEEENLQPNDRTDSVNQSFDSLLGNKKSNLKDIRESDSQPNITGEVNSLNSDHLGLDDLMELMEEEAVDTSSAPIDSRIIINPTNGNIENASKEENNVETNTSNSEKTQSYTETDTTLNNGADNIEVVAEENLQLESLIDLVNEGEENQNLSSLKNLENAEDVEAMDYQGEND